MTDVRGSRISRLAGVCMLAGALSGCTAPAPMPMDELRARLGEHNRVHVPAGRGPFPAVLLLHTCYGNLGHVDAWAKRLRSHGYVAVVVNSMQARDLDGHFDRLAVCAGRALRASDRARDIDVSIEQLRELGVVDVQRVGIVGFSHGGWTALDYLGQGVEAASEDASTTGLAGVKSVVVVYPYCGKEPAQTLAAWPRELRLLMLLAGNDTTVGTARCESLAHAQRARGHAIDVHIYPDAEHGYDIEPALIFGYDQRYDESAARDTRARIIDFLDDTLARRVTAQPSVPGGSAHVQSSDRRMR